MDGVAAETGGLRKGVGRGNLFGDVANSIGDRGSAYKRLDAPLNTIYEKLFGGNNLPSMTPKGEHFIPKWTAEQIRSIAEILGAGLRMFESSTRPWPQLE